MKIFRTTLIFASILFLSSCSSYDDLDIGRVEAYKFKGFKDNKLNFELTIPIDNDNPYNIIIREINLNAYVDKKPLGIIEMNNKIIITKQSSLDYVVPVTIRITNLFGSLSLMSNPRELIQKLSFEGYIKVRKGILFNTIEIDRETSGSYIRF